MYNNFYTAPNDYLMHHGVKGQKCGIRKYQNPDGSLTPEGIARYEKNGKIAGMNRISWQSDKLKRELYKDYKSQNPNASREDKIKAQRKIDYNVTAMNRKYISDNEGHLQRQNRKETTAYAILGTGSALAGTLMRLSPNETVKTVGKALQVGGATTAVSGLAFGAAQKGIIHSVNTEKGKELTKRFMNATGGEKYLM